MCAILVVEGNQLFREALCNILRVVFPESHIQEAQSGTEAMLHFDSLYPGVIFLDMQLRNGRWKQLASEMKSRNPTARILMLTLFDDPLYRAAALENGADAFLVKGDVSTQEIIELVEEAVTAGRVSPEESHPLTPAHDCSCMEGAVECFQQSSQFLLWT